MTREAGRLDHEYFDLIYSCPGILKGDFDIPGPDRVEACLDRFGS